MFSTTEPLYLLFKSTHSHSLMNPKTILGPSSRSCCSTAGLSWRTRRCRWPRCATAGCGSRCARCDSSRRFPSTSSRRSRRKASLSSASTTSGPTRLENSSGCRSSERPFTGSLQFSSNTLASGLLHPKVRDPLSA